MVLKAVIERRKVDAAFERYIAKNGYHFTTELAETVVGTTGVPYELTAPQKLWLKGTGYTEGDLAYLIGMFSSDFPSLSLEVLCKNTLLDADGYEGMVFKRWLTDLKGRNQEIDWEDYV